jgi:PAS domain S-box-containing protein
MHEGQAQVVADRCIACGTCVRECPQHAKSFRNDIDRTARLLASGHKVAASLAPSLVAAFPKWQQRRLASGLRRLGFSYVAETAIGAYMVAQLTAEIVDSQPNRSHICTACPAVVAYIERYRPDMVTYLVPVVSPMLAHAKHIRQKFGDGIKVVFIGPCIAKKAEAERPEVDGLVDCVLTFTELAEWFEREGIDLSACEESDFDELPQGDARLFPLEGGCVRTAGWAADLLSGEVVVAGGFAEVCTALDSLGGADPPRIVEPLFCPQGCINGPAMVDQKNLFCRRSDVLQYAAENPGLTSADAPRPELAAKFSVDTRIQESPVTEEQIRKVLEHTGKIRVEDQLNCGACGYATCRDKAVAVIRGMAEPEMCIPHMRRLAEQRVDRIIETSPNGIVILDDQLHILSMNPAFRRFFMCSEAVCGQAISYLMDPEPFERLASGQADLIDSTVEHQRYNLVCHQILYPLREERQYVGIFVNITNNQASQKQLAHLRSQTVLQARELLEHQIQMAETLAKYLGDSTARGEDLVEKLMLLAAGEDKATSGKKGQWLRDTYTST